MERNSEDDHGHVGELHLHEDLPPVQPFSKLHTIQASLGDIARTVEQRQHLSRIASWVAQTGAPLRKLGFYTRCRDRPLPPFTRRVVTGRYRRVHALTSCASSSSARSGGGMGLYAQDQCESSTRYEHHSLHLKTGLSPRGRREGARAKG